MSNMVFGSRINIAKGTTFIKSGESVKSVYLIVNGRVKAENEYLCMQMENGAMVGILDICSGKNMFDYEALTDTTALYFEIQDTQHIKNVLRIGKNYQEIAVNSLFAQYHEIYQLYETKLLPFVPMLGKVSQNQQEAVSVEQEQCAYMNDIAALDKNVFHVLFTAGESIAYEHIVKGAVLAKEINDAALRLIGELGTTMLGIEKKTIKPQTAEQDNKQENERVEEKKAEEQKTESNPEQAASSKETEAESKEEADAGVTVEAEPEVTEYDYDLVQRELGGSLKKIIDFSGMDLMESSKLTITVSKYLGLPDRNSADNDVRLLRKELAEQFYVLYEKVFMRVINGAPLNRAVELFLKFGFMEEKEFDKETLAQLYYFNPNLNKTKYSIYTVYDWLVAVYEGRREPSKDEFDMDYREMVRAKKAQEHLSQADENKMLADQIAKVQFEIRNMFRVVNRITTNEITIFSPILTQKRFSKDIRNMFVSAEKFSETMDSILNIDYSLFHREQMHYDPEHKIDNIMVMKQVLPDIILMPNVGSRGVMWQEISEKKRDTPARFILSAFFIGNLETTLIDMCAAYRWEICRTIQGNYWNDISEHSLTSEYCDYVQFYRKNKDLTEEVKEKVRAQFKASRNSFREMFTKDYEVWVKYESQNSIRLNKVARGILYMYCPFAAEYRKKLEAQPIFNAASGRFERERIKKVKELKTFNSNVLKRGGQITEVLQNNLDFYEHG